MALAVLMFQGGESFAPLAHVDSNDERAQLWRLCNKVRESLKDRSRLENLSWRLWHQQQLKCELHRACPLPLSTVRQQLQTDNAPSRWEPSAGPPTAKHLFLAATRQSDRNKGGYDTSPTNALHAHWDQAVLFSPDESPLANFSIPPMTMDMEQPDSRGLEPSGFPQRHPDAGCDKMIGSVHDDIQALIMPPPVPLRAQGSGAEVQHGMESCYPVPVPGAVHAGDMDRITSMYPSSSPTVWGMCEVGASSPGVCFPSQRLSPNLSHPGSNTGPVPAPSDNTTPTSTVMSMPSTPSISHGSPVNEYPMPYSVPLHQPLYTRDLASHHQLSGTFEAEHKDYQSLSISHTASGISHTAPTSAALVPPASFSSLCETTPGHLPDQNYGHHDYATYPPQSLQTKAPSMPDYYAGDMKKQEPTGRREEEHHQDNEDLDDEDDETDNDDDEPICANCGATSTPLWRRSSEEELLCNACGLYEKLHNAPRPKTLKPHNTRKEPRETNTPKLTCFNCSTTTTPLWRRDNDGFPLCNACGLYLKLHQEMRPLSMKTDKIKKRQRYEADQYRKKSKKYRLFRRELKRQRQEAKKAAEMKNDTKYTTSPSSTASPASFPAPSPPDPLSMRNSTSSTMDTHPIPSDVTYPGLYVPLADYYSETHVHSTGLQGDKHFY